MELVELELAWIICPTLCLVLGTEPTRTKFLPSRCPYVWEEGHRPADKCRRQCVGLDKGRVPRSGSALGWLEGSSCEGWLGVGDVEESQAEV